MQAVKEMLQSERLRWNVSNAPTPTYADFEDSTPKEHEKNKGIWKKNKKIQ